MATFTGCQLRLSTRAGRCSIFAMGGFRVQGSVVQGSGFERILVPRYRQGATHESLTRRLHGIDGSRSGFGSSFFC